MIIHFAADHAGYEMKNTLMAFVTEELGLSVKDHGAYEYQEGDDYPDFVVPAARAVSESDDMAVILGGSGQGEAMAANHISGVRAVVYYGGSQEILTLSREHNNANVLSLGARFIDPEEAKEAVRLWLATPFTDDERHVRRIGKMDSST